MKRMVRTTLCFFVVAGLLVFGCGTAKNSVAQSRQITNGAVTKAVDIENLKPGIAAYNATKFDYKRGRKKMLAVELKEPTVVAVATQPEKWGFFQFPKIQREQDNSLLISWNLNADAMEAYGNHRFGTAVSTDEGKSWRVVEQRGGEAGFELPNGDLIKVNTPKPIKATELNLPKPIGKGFGDTYSKSPYEFYKLEDLPEQVNGVFLDRLAKGATEWKTERASLFDPQGARYTLRGMFPVVWWGDLHTAKDGSVIAGIYPGFEITSSGVNPYHQTVFYRSTDNGHSWKIQGRIPYIPDTSVDTAGKRRMGLMEPASEILSDGSFVCVMRTTDGIGNGPMYISRSKDLGVTWTKPEILTSSGVLPHLLQLKNGVLVMASGRPGVQLRFSTDGEGKTWTDPFEMMAYKNYADQVSCGYTGLLPTGPDRFLIVYSDFKYPNKEGEPRKAIKVREVIVRPYK